MQKTVVVKRGVFSELLISETRNQKKGRKIEKKFDIFQNF